MFANTSENLDLLIAEEKSRVANEVFTDAWQAAVNEGIEAPILAEAALTNALKQLYRQCGEQAVADLLDTVSMRLESGHFDPGHSLQ